MGIKQGNDYIIKTTDEWYSPDMRDTVIPEGCICIEKSENSGLSIKIGDGFRTFINLPYISNESVNLAEYAKLSYVDEKFSNLDYELPIADTNTLGGVQSGSNVTSTDGLIPVPIIDGIPYYRNDSSTSQPAGEDLGSVKSGGDVTITNGLISVNDNSHNHVIDNIDGLQSVLDGKISVSSRGIAGGIAELDTNGKVLSSQLPLADTNTLGGVQSGSNVTSTDGLIPVPIIDGIPYYRNDSSTSQPAGEDLGSVKSGGDVTITNGLISVNDNSHNHVIDNIDGLQSVLDGKISVSSRGIAGGIAELDTNGKVLSSQLPSYVDAIVEGYYNSTDDKFYNEEEYTIEIPGESNKIYIDKLSSMIYRWTGERFGNIGGSLVLGETSSTAYRGDRGSVAFTHSQLVTGNPHKVTKADVGLGNVDNVSTNDQSPTYTVPATATALTSGEKLTVAMGKIAKTVENAISHENNNLIHVTSVEKTAWNNKQDKLNTGTNTTTGTTKLYNTTGDNADGTITQMALTAMLGEKASKSTVQNVIVASNSWSGVSAPYSATIAVTGATQNNLIEVTIPGDIIDDQLIALKSAQVDKITQSTDNITLYAYGTKPTIDIPITVVIRGDI